MKNLPRQTSLLVLICDISVKKFASHEAHHSHGYAGRSLCKKRHFHLVVFQYVCFICPLLTE